MLSPISFVDLGAIQRASDAMGPALLRGDENAAGAVRRWSASAARSAGTTLRALPRKFEVAGRASVAKASRIKALLRLPSLGHHAPTAPNFQRGIIRTDILTDSSSDNVVSPKGYRSSAEITQLDRFGQLDEFRQLVRDSFAALDFKPGEPLEVTTFMRTYSAENKERNLAFKQSLRTSQDWVLKVTRPILAGGELCSPTTGKGLSDEEVASRGANSAHTFSALVEKMFGDEIPVSPELLENVRVMRDELRLLCAENGVDPEDQSKLENFFLQNTLMLRGLIDSFMPLATDPQVNDRAKGAMQYLMNATAGTLQKDGGISGQINPAIQAAGERVKAFIASVKERVDALPAPSSSVDAT